MPNKILFLRSDNLMKNKGNKIKKKINNIIKKNIKYIFDTNDDIDDDKIK